MLKNKITKFLKSQFFIAFFAGAMCMLAFSPFYLIIFAPISLSIFFFLLNKEKEGKKSFLLGLSFGFGYFLAGNYWIAISLFVDLKSFGWLIPFALTLIPSILGLYIAFLAITYKKIIFKFHFNENYQKILIFSILWIIFESLRSTLFTGFPWNLLGYIFMINEVFVQSANIFGIYGLSFLAVLTSLLPILFLKNNHKKNDKIFALIITIIFSLNIIYSKIYFQNHPLKTNNKIKLRLVQSNIEQDLKWNPKLKYQNFLKTIALTNSKNLDDINLVIWSETATPYAINDDKKLLEKLKLATPKNGALFTGALRLEVEEDQIKDAFNSAFLLDGNGVKSFYDKHHLVPFGEYIPLQKYFPFVSKITQGSVGFSSGKGPQTLIEKDLKISPLICYEVIFFNKIIDKNNRPNLLINTTNDAWFGVSSGPYQHFDMARMRSVEYGIPLARAANTGISAFIDPFGRVVKKSALNEEKIIDVNLIEALPSTIFEKYGHFFLILIILLVIILLGTVNKGRIYFI